MKNNFKIEELVKNDLIGSSSAGEIELKRTDKTTEVRDLLSLVDQAFCEIEKNFKDVSLSEAYNRIVALVHFLTYAVQLAEKNGWIREDIRAELFNAWRIHGYSSFVKHVQTWPRGYPGDFEAINMIVDRKEEAAPDTLGGIIGWYSLNSAIAQQHREKLKIQTELVKETCRRFVFPKIVSIASGSSRDLEQIQYELKESQAKVLLVDFDPDALKESKQRLSEINDQVDTFLINVRKLPIFFRGLSEKGGKFHLIYAGGLFDYLPDGIIKIILRSLSEKFIHEDGILMFTNIAQGNPYRAWIETMGNWKLIERSKTDIEELLSHIEINPCEQSLELDPTGLTWIVKVLY